MQTKSNLKKYVKPQKELAQRMGLTFIKDIQVSPLAKKKYRVLLKDGYFTPPEKGYVDYGDINSEDYLQHKNEERRTRFHQRWRNNPRRDDIHSPVFYILRLTW